MLIPLNVIVPESDRTVPARIPSIASMPLCRVPVNPMISPALIDRLMPDSRVF